MIYNIGTFDSLTLFLSGSGYKIKYTFKSTFLMNNFPFREELLYNDVLIMDSRRILTIF